MCKKCGTDFAGKADSWITVNQAYPLDQHQLTVILPGVFPISSVGKFSSPQMWATFFTSRFQFIRCGNHVDSRVSTQTGMLLPQGLLGIAQGQMIFPNPQPEVDNQAESTLYPEALPLHGFPGILQT